MSAFPSDPRRSGEKQENKRGSIANLRDVYIGLRSTSLAHLQSPVSGLLMSHWHPGATIDQRHSRSSFGPKKLRTAIGMLSALCDEGTAPGLPEAIWSKLRGHGSLVEHGVVAIFGFGGRDVSDGLQQAAMVEHGVIAVRLAPPSCFDCEVVAPR